jgi:hypothetical protein
VASIVSDVANMSTGELIEYRPISPVELELIIRELGDRLEHAVPVLRDLWARRYSTERDFIEGHAKAMLMSKQPTVAMARKEADLATLDLKRQFDDAKEILHAAEALQKALAAKLMGYQNINKVQASAYAVGGVGR